MRYRDWQTRLAAYIKEHREKPFEWGNNDCCLFPCNAVLMMTGKDLAHCFKGKYSTKLGAWKTIKAFGCNTIEEVAIKMNEEFCFTENEKNFHQRGDVALCEVRGEETLGLVDLTGKYVLIAGENGISRHPLDCIKRSWRVE